MMSGTKTDIERLIGRCLDGEASEQEQLELQREMLRDPDVRRMFDESQCIDELAGGVLRRMLPDPCHATLARTASSQGMAGQQETSPESATQAEVLNSRVWWRSPPKWLFIPGAIAAAILALIIPSPMGWAPMSQVTDHQTASPSHPQPLVRPLTETRGIATPPVPIMANGMQAGDGLMRNVGLGTPQIQRKSGREVLGIIGDDGNIYWIEIDRTRTFRGRFPSPETSNISETF